MDPDEGTTGPPRPRDTRWVTNRLVNPVLRRLLRGGAGRVLGRTLAVIRYRGRRTGRTRELVVQYARDGDTVWVVPAHPGAKRWWRNFEPSAHVEVWLGGDHSAAIASLLRADRHRAALDDALAVYLEQLPRARAGLARAAGGSEGAPHVAVMVRLELHGTI